MIEMINAYLEEAEQSFDLSLMKVEALMEASKRQLEINYTAAELKVMQENGTDDDLAYLLEEANNGLLESAKASIKKILDAIIKFFSDLRDKISSSLFSQENKRKLEELQKKIKVFPLIGKKKVVVEDISKHEKNANKHLSDLAKLKAKAKSGQSVSPEDVDKVQKSFMEEHGKLIGVGAAITVTVAAAIGLLVAFNKGGFQKIQKTEAEGKRSINDTLDNVEKGKIPPNVGTKLASAESSILKTSTASMFRGISGTFSSVKKALVGGVDGAVQRYKEKKNEKVNVKKAIEILGLEGSNYDLDDINHILFESDNEGGEVDNSPAETPDSESSSSDDSSSDMKTEEGDYDDPIDSIPTVDNEPDTDPWDDVMRDDPETSLDNSINSRFNDEEETTFESAYSKFFNDITLPATNGGIGNEKPSNEKIISSLFSDIMASARKQSELTGHAILKESEEDLEDDEPIEEKSMAEKLLDDIDQLF